MKKILSVALVALLAAGSLFAGISGSASVGLGYDFENKTYGFENLTSLNKLEVELQSETKENVAEGAIYAGIKASFKFSTTLAKGASWDKVVEIKVKSSFAEAYITNGAWKLSILSAGKGIDFASSAIDTYKKDGSDKAVTYAAPFAGAPGVTFTYADWAVGLGFIGKDKVMDFSATVQTPEFAFGDVKVKAGAIASTKTYNKDGKADFDYTNMAIGASLKASYTTDAFSATAAADAGLVQKVKGDKFAFAMDAALNVAVSPITLDAYYANKMIKDQTTVDNLLSVQVKTDLANFSVPVALTVTGKDLINTQDLSAKATATLDKIELTVGGGYVIKTKKVSANADVKYTADLFTAKAGVAWSIVVGTDNSMVLAPTASIESSSIIPGAKLSLAYGKSTSDLNVLAKSYGKVTAKCEISF